MNSDDFEKKLERQPMRAVPAGWRAQILREARLAATLEPPAWQAWVRELLWPRPLAWGSLAAAWVVIAVFHTATPATPLVARQATSSGNAMQSLAEQRREMAALLDFSTETATPQRSKPPGPRSELALPASRA